MNLDDAQKQQVSGWIEQGLKISDIQTRIASELGIKLTYLETRFLLDDLKLKPKDTQRPAETVVVNGQSKGAPPPSSPATGAPAGMTPMGGEDDLAGLGDVSVTVDQVTRAGALVSGKVKFSDGNTAEWQLDQFGRLGLSAQAPGYRPPQEDLMAFQTELQRQLSQLGY